MSANAASVAALIVLLTASIQSYAGCSPTLPHSSRAHSGSSIQCGQISPGKREYLLPTAPYLPVPTRFG
jgi:hypothetical protein